MIVSLLKKIKSNLSSNFRSLFPLYVIKRNLRKGILVENEMELLPYIGDKNATAIDVGANIGLYTYSLSNKFKNVISFEPIASLYKNLLRSFKSFDNVEIHNAALSDRDGEETLFIPERFHAWSTLEKDNPMLNVASKEQKIIEVKITLKRLDDYKLNNISFIKIDVEGHEMKVLEGAAETIKNNNPLLLIEVEERHKQGAVGEVAGYLSNFGYNAFFYIDNKLHPLNKFDYTKHHNPEKNPNSYVYNFIFFHKSYGLNKLKAIISE